MLRQARKESVTGIFHVMMRGINHQNISDLRSSLLTLDNAQAILALYSLNHSLEDEEDNWQFINTLDRMRMRTDDNGLPCGTNCTYYAYCLKKQNGRF